ncbi:DUF1552 domain-containing protein [Aurantivibrio plasticivorans]
MAKHPKFTRRSLLRGALRGASYVVALPTLNMFLNENGNAYADGSPLPIRLGTYFWGLGLTPGRWVPEKIGAGYELTPELQSLKGLQHKVSVFSGFRVLLDGRPNIQHWTGQGAILTGLAPATVKAFDRPSFDVAAAEQLGGGTRFRSVQLTPFGNPKLSYSTPTGNGFNTPDASPLALYNRLFGEGFQDPNSPNWRPDPNTILRKSVLSTVGEQRKALMANAGSEDRIKLDQYFTSVRELEEQLAVELKRPPKAEACVVPQAPEDRKRSGEIYKVNENNILMGRLMAMALACNQTKVFSVVHTSATSETYLPGDSNIYHLHTHDEPVDTELGYQVISSELAELSFRGFGDFLRELDAVPEGDGTLLDNSMVLGFSDTGYAKIHSTDNIPMFIAGSAGGRHKTGQHVVGNGDPVSRISLTAQQLAGMSVGEFGQGSMKTDRVATEVFA